MKRNSRALDWKGVTLATVGGGVAIVVGAQLLARPTEPAVAGLPRRSAPAAVARSVAEERPAPPPPALRIAGRPAAEAPIRELFRPLVSREAPARPVAPAPALPPARWTPPAPARAPERAAPAPPPAPAAPETPSVSQIQMLGVVESSAGARVLLKKTDTGESRYVARGEEVWGFKVVDFTDSQVSLEREGQTSTVAMSTLVTIEGPGASSAASAVASSSGSSEAGGFGGRGSRWRFGGRGDRERGDRGRGGSESGGVNTAELFSLPTWSERLKKLEEIKGQLEPERYERLKRFMEERARRESGR